MTDQRLREGYERNLAFVRKALAEERPALSDWAEVLDDAVTEIDRIVQRDDEAEATAREAQPGPWRFHREGQELQILAADGDLVTEWTYGVRPWVPADWDEADMRAPNHIARHDPARVLREVEAKRRIVDWCAEVIGDRDLSGYDRFGSLADDPNAMAVTLAVETLRNLTSPDADHPDYDPSWRLAE